MKKNLIALFGLCLFLGSSLAVTAKAADGAGESLYRKHCASCHGDDGAKKPIGASPLKGQAAEDIRTKLAGYQDGTYGGDNKLMMVKALKKLSDKDLQLIEEFMKTFNE